MAQAAAVEATRGFASSRARQIETGFAIASRGHLVHREAPEKETSMRILATLVTMSLLASAGMAQVRTTTTTPSP
jgi:hypothetical protein